MSVRKSKYKIKKVKKREVKISNLQTFILLLPLVLFLIFLACVACLFFWKMDQDRVQMPKSLTSKEYNQGQQYPIKQWNTYTNEKFGFSIKYPKLGYIQNPKCFDEGKCNGEVLLSPCQNGIKDEALTKSSSLITLGNMLGIIVYNYNGPIDTFIKSQGGNPNDFILDQTQVTGADESVYVTLNKDSKMTPQIPSILTPTYLIKKGGNIYQIALLQNFGSKTGCLPPAGTSANTFKSIFWNIPKSVSFN